VNVVVLVSDEYSACITALETVTETPILTPILTEGSTLEGSLIDMFWFKLFPGVTAVNWIRMLFSANVGI